MSLQNFYIMTDKDKQGKEKTSNNEAIITLHVYSNNSGPNLNKSSINNILPINNKQIISNINSGYY